MAENHYSSDLDIALNVLLTNVSHVELSVPADVAEVLICVARLLSVTS